MEESCFTKGMAVEVCSDDQGLRGAWFVAEVVRSTSKMKKVLVEYKTLLAEERGSKPLRELVDEVNLRPIPPREPRRAFKEDDDVDAYHNDGWWEGVVIKVLRNFNYLVYFRGAKEELVFPESDLRIHREWRGGDSWVPPMEWPDFEETLHQLRKQKHKNQNSSTGLEIEQNKRSSKMEMEFSEGMHVEVSSDEDGFLGAWFTAKIIKLVGKFKFLVEYDSLRTDDESSLLKEEVDGLHIRPLPPRNPQVDSFSRLQKVDAFYNDAWWVGVVSKVLSNSTYRIFFRESHEELDFSLSQLRIHQDWIDGKWVKPSRVCHSITYRFSSHSTGFAAKMVYA